MSIRPLTPEKNLTRTHDNNIIDIHPISTPTSQRPSPMTEIRSISSNDGGHNNNEIKMISNSNSNPNLTKDIWAQHSVSELRTIEQEKRSQAEQKKEELRQLVGLRYRVLIESADSILNMKHLTQYTLNFINDVSTALNDLETRRSGDLGKKITLISSSSSSSSSSLPAERKDEVKGYPWDQYVSEISLLDARIEEIWEDIGKHSYLNACENLTETQNKLTRIFDYLGGWQQGLQVEEDKKSFRTFTCLLTQHQQLLAQMPKLLHKHAMQRIKTPHLLPQEYAEALITLCILPWYRKTTPKQTAITLPNTNIMIPVGAVIQSPLHLSNESRHEVLLMFLDARTTWLKRVLHAGETTLQTFAKSSSSSVPSTSSQTFDPTQTACHLMSVMAKTLRSTIIQTCHMFVSTYAEIKRSSSPTSSSSTLSSSSTPNTLSALYLSSNILQQELNTWLKNAVNLCVSKLEKILSYLTTGEQIGKARDAVLICLCGESQDSLVDNNTDNNTDDALTPKTVASSLDDQKEIKDSKSTNTQENKTVIPGLEPIDVSGKRNDSKNSMEEHLKKLRRERVTSSFQDWKEVCRYVLGQVRPVNLWDLIFQNTFAQKSQAIISHAFEGLDLDSLLEHNSLDLKENKTQIPSSTSTSTLSVDSKKNENKYTDDNKSLGSKGLETKKTEEKQTNTSNNNNIDGNDFWKDVEMEVEEGGIGYIGVQNICEKFDQHLKNLILDIQYLLESPYLSELLGPSFMTPSSAPSTPTSSPHLAFHSLSPSLASSLDPSLTSLQRLTDEELKPYIQKMCSQSVSRMVSALQLKLAGVRGQLLDSSDLKQAAILADQAVFIGRVCQRLAHHSKPLKEIVTLDKLHATPSPSPTLNNISFSFANSASPTGVDESSSGALSSLSLGRLRSIQTSLLSTAHQAFRIWTAFLASNLGENFTKNLKVWLSRYTLTDTKHSIETLTGTWTKSDDISSSSSLSYPSQPSSYINLFLFQLSSHLYRINGHRLSPEVVSWVLSDVIQSLLNTTQKLLINSNSSSTKHSLVQKQSTSLLSTSLPEPIYVQLLFDIQFLFSVLRLPVNETSSSSTSTSTSTSSSSSAFLDDLDISQPVVSARHRYSSLIQHLESLIDPINLSTLRKPLLSSLSFNLQQTQVVYGTLIRHNPFPPLLTSSSSTTSNLVGQKRTSDILLSSSISSPSTSTSSNFLLVAPSTTRVLEFPIALYPVKT